MEYTNSMFGIRVFWKFVPMFFGFFLFGGFWTQIVFAQEAVETKVELEQKIDELEKEADVLDANLRQAKSETASLAAEVATINAEVERRELAIRRINAAIRKADLEIAERTRRIQDLSVKIDKTKETLAASLFILYTYDQENILTVLLKNNSISQFFSALNGLQSIQVRIQKVLAESRDDRDFLERQKEELQEFQEEQGELKSLQEVERNLLARKKREKDALLRLTKGKEALFQQILSVKQRNLSALKTQLFYLEQTGITAERAMQIADRAAKNAGIRTAFLLALLEVETGKRFKDGVISVGSNIGSGNWRDDLYECYRRLGRYYGGSNIKKYYTRAEREKEAFFKITSGLGLDPDQMKVSKEPPYIGCGGAMGPAQFLPSTWLLFEKKVAKITGHNPPNPWDHEDAFTASAVFLADAGARLQTPEGEMRAAKTYISGRPSCGSTICNVYSRQILSLAEDIDQVL